MNFAVALSTLARHGVEHVVVGGVAVVVHGSSLMTRDLDILYRLGPENVDRLVAAFDELDAVAWGDPRRLRFTAAHLDNRGHHLTETRAGRIDALGSLGRNADILYEDVALDAIEVEAFETRFKCISLPRLIAVKRELGRPRDLLAVQELEAIAKLQGG
ncbi:MAG: hypothetical protein KC586_24645 [Myxococcales bacterium]|nr:hypothetical protein [Myxococcales bacterium]